MNLHLSLRLIATCIGAVLCCGAFPTLHADTVVLKNGDRLTGTAIKLDGGKLTFKTAYSDPIVLVWDQVASLKLTQALMLPLPQGIVNVTSIDRSDTGLIVTGPSGPVTMEPAAVTVLRTPADQKAYEATLHPGWGHAWAGAANVSFALAHGNSETETFGAGLAAARQTRTDKTSLYVNTLYSKNAHAVPEVSANTTAGGLRYDHNVNPRFFVFGTGDFLSNALQDLDLRSILGGGFGWHASKTDKQNLDVLGGIVWTHENYSANASGPAVTNSFAAIDLGQQYTRKLGSASLFTEQAYIYPDLNSLSKYQFTLNSTFSTKIGKMFTWITTFNDNYTSFPPAGTVSNDVILTTGLGVALSRP